jgi:hypothetical protein
MKQAVAPGAWNAEKVEAFKDAFLRFLNYVTIDSKETGPTTLGKTVYEAQRRALECIFAGLANDVHDFKILKSRQLGISTITEALDVFWLGMHEGCQGALIFDTSAHLEKARERIVNLINLLPAKLKFPKIVSNNRYSLTLSNRSTVAFMAAGTRSSRGGGSLGASMGLNFIHSSEMCSWNNDEGLASLRAAMAKEFPNRLFIWESTARGFNSWFDMWEGAKTNDISEGHVFIGWWAKETQRFKKGTPLFERYGTDPLTEAEEDRIAEVKERYDYDIDMEQVAWYRHEANKGQEEDASGELCYEPDEYTAQNQPWTEDDAFQQSGSSFFRTGRLTEIARAEGTKKFTPYNFRSASEFMYMSMDKAKSHRGCHFKVWEEPHPNGVYVIGADPAYGHDEGNDRSALQVLRCYADQVEQVAEFAYSEVPTNQFAWIIASILGGYSASPQSSARLILEINGPGEAVWNEYRTLKQQILTGYLRAPAMEAGLANIFSNVRQYIHTRADSMSAGSVYHWKTSPMNKVGLLERCRDFVETGAAVLHSQDLLSEMKSISRVGDSIAAEGNKKDDRVFALALACRAWEQFERKGLIANCRTRTLEDARNRKSMKDQLQMLNEFRIQEFLNRKKKARAADAQAAMKRSWRGR